MPIKVNPAKDTIEWSDFKEVGSIKGSAIARAGYMPSFVPARFPRRVVNKRFYLPENLVIRVNLFAQVERSADQTDALLAHEQLHYHVGVLCARALAKEVEGLNAKTHKALVGLFNKASKLHFGQRGGALQKAIDDQTGHGLKSAEEADWEKAMAECLANPSLTRVMGLPL